MVNSLFRNELIVFVVIKMIDALNFLDPVHSRIGQRSEERLITDLEQILIQDHVQDGGIVHRAPEGDHHEDDGIQTFTDQRGEDRADPELLPFRGNFQFGKHDGIGKFTEQIADRIPLDISMV